MTRDVRLSSQGVGDERFPVFYIVIILISLIYIIHTYSLIHLLYTLSLRDTVMNVEKGVGKPYHYWKTLP